MIQTDYDYYFSDLYGRHFNMVVKYLMRILRDLCLAEDLAHDLFFKFYEKKVQIDGDERRIRSYILKSAKNMALDHLRAERKRQERYSHHIPEIAEISEAFYAELENICISGEIISTVRDVLLDFPHRTRRIFMDMVEGKRLKDVSCEQSMSRYMAKKDYEEVCRAMRDKLRIFRD